jgi:hypothetical protein
MLPIPSTYSLSPSEIEAAITAHAGWRARFETAIHGIDAEKLTELAIADHTQCALGVWLHAGIAPSSANPETIQALIGAHETFHREATKIIAFLNEGNADEALQLLDTGFSEISNRVTELLQALVANPAESFTQQSPFMKQRTQLE